jgi:CheY-like chemotaxis protein
VAQNHRVALQWQLKEPLPDVTADEEKLKTIILNLLSNAIKFTPENGSVHVHAAWNNGMFTFEVTDTGCGIPPDELPLIFNRFYQARHTLAKATGGTGIGLSLVKMYTELMQGKILVKSTLNKGSTFSVSLPLPKAQTPAAQPQVTALPEPENHKEEALPEKPLILLIDDADEVRLLLKTCLGSTYRYAEAANGKTGWEATLAYMPDMIISDLMMPVMDGLELCRKIKTDARTRHIPFLMLTAKAGDENKLSGLQGGADEYLVKPFSREELMARVHNLLQLREHIRRQVRSTMLTQATPVQAVSAEEQFVLTARRLVEENLTNPALSVEWLAEQLNLGREQCYRKMMAITGIPPSAFIRKIRLHRAAQLLAAKWGPVSQVAYEVGFENLSHFSKAFKEQFGKLPSEYNG